MPLLVTQDDLRPFVDEYVEEVLQVIREALLHQHPDQLGYLTWWAFPLAHEERRINIHALMSPQAGTTIRVYPTVGNRESKDTSLVLLFDDQDGHLLALLAGDDLTPLRTAAPVALACQYLARPDASTLAMLGSGEQSRYQLRLILHQLPSLRRNSL